MATEDEGTEVEETEEPEEVEETDADQPEEDDDPAAIKAERDKLRTTYAKVKAERTKLRAELAKARESKDEKAEEEDAEAKSELRVKRLAGQTALAAEGLTKPQAKVAVRLLDLTDVEVDEDGDADFEDAIEELKALFPSLFAKQEGTGRTPPRKVTTSDRGGKGASPTVDKMSERLLRQGGYRR